MAAEIISIQGDNEGNVPRMLGIKEAAQETGLPEHLIRTLALDGEIPAIRSGSKKIWVSAKGLIDYLTAARLK